MDNYDGEPLLEDNSDSDDILGDKYAGQITTDIDTIPPSSPGKRSIFGKVILAFIAGFVITLGVIAYFFLRNTDILSFVPENSEVVMNITINGLNKIVFSDQVQKLKENKEALDRLNRISDSFMTGLFFKQPVEGLNTADNFFNFIDSDMVIACFNTGKLFLKRGTFSSSGTEIDRLGIFRMNNKEKVSEYFKIIQDKYRASEREINGYKVFVTQDFCYIFKDTFVVIATNPDILMLSMDTINGKNKSILKNDKFILYKNRISSNSIGFMYFNLGPMRESFYNNTGISKASILASFIDSFKLAGISAAASTDGLTIEGLVLPEDNIQSSMAQKFFSQKSRVPSSLKFFPGDTSNVFLFTNVVELFQILKEMMVEVYPDMNNNIVYFLENSLKLDIERDIFASLTGELAFNLPFKSIDELAVNLALKQNKIFDGTVIILGIKKDSRLRSLIAGADTVMSFFSSGNSYRDVNIIVSPDGSFSYCFIDDFLIVTAGGGGDRLKEIIDTEADGKDNIDKLYEVRRKNKFSRECTLLSYINLRVFSGKPLSGNDGVKSFSEIWGNTGNYEKGFKSIIYMVRSESEQ